MRILVDDIYAQVVNPKGNAKATSIVRQVCRARPDGYQFTPKYKSGHWDGYISLMHGFASFPSGLLTMVMSKLSEEGIEVETVHTADNLPYKQPITPDLLSGITLRDYQIRAANSLITATRGVAKMATNSGKTEVMAAVIKALDAKAIVLVHRKELLKQAADRFIARGLSDVGMIGDGVWKPGKITVCMIQTLANHLAQLDWANDNAIVFVDECHHLSSDQVLNVLSAIPGQYRFGVSGTPLKYEVLSDMKLLAYTGPVVCEVSNEFLIEQGYSAKPTVYVKTIEDFEDKHWNLGWYSAYQDLIVNSKYRNRYIADIATNADGTVLILVNQIDHGNNLKNLMPDAVFVNGNDSTEYRQKVIQDMKAGKGIFIASPIFDEGVDIPAIDYVIIAAGGKSHIKLLQRIGRGMRQKGGEDNVLQIYDFIDDTNEYLLRHSNERIECYVNEGFATKLI